MKFVSKILLLLFFTFLSTPTCVMLIERSTDISIFYASSEEEEELMQKDVKEVKALLNLNQELFSFLYKINSNSKIISEKASFHENEIIEINAPPPKLV